MFKNRLPSFSMCGQPILGALVIAGAACTVALPSLAQESRLPSQTPIPTRADVVADLVRWQRAEMDRFQPLATSYGLETEAYQQAYLDYLCLTDIDRRGAGTAELPRR